MPPEADPAPAGFSWPGRGKTTSLGSRRNRETEEGPAGAASCGATGSGRWRGRWPCNGPAEGTHPQELDAHVEGEVGESRDDVPRVRHTEGVTLCEVEESRCALAREARLHVERQRREKKRRREKWAEEGKGGVRQ